MTTFVSYATEYDMYKGSKNWSALTTKQQDDIIKAELVSDSDPEALIMRYNLIKKQAQGLRGLFIYISMALEKAGRIEDITEWNDHQRDQIIQFLKGTGLGRRLEEAFVPPKGLDRQPVSEEELELFADTEYDYLLDLSLREVKSELFDDLELLPIQIATDHLDQPVARHLYGVNATLNEVFRKILIPKGVSPKVSETVNFPFDNYSNAVNAIKSGKAHLSFSSPSAYAFNAVATKSESYLHTFLMLAYALFAPISLFAGVYLTQNYYLLFLGLLWLPLAFFGTHPSYRSAPKFIFMSIITIAYGVYFESGSWMVAGTFMLLCITGYSATRYYYNKIIIKRALEMEKAFMFLLGSNALYLCGQDWSRLWLPKWLEDA